MKRILLLFVFLMTGLAGIFAQTSLEGKVTDAGSGEPILFGTVALYKNGNLVTGVETDLDGNYFFSDVDPGTYDLESQYIGYTTNRITGVIVKAGKTNRVNFMLSSGVLIDVVEIVEYKVPLIEIDNTTQGGTVTAEQIRSLPNKNINAIAAQTAGISSTDGGAINVRGSRSNATVYYIDGVRVSGLIPQSEIEQLQVITGGIEAKYGDVTGGIISLTSKGPSRRFSGGVEFETSEYLDGYGYNLISGNLSGPILKNSKGESIVGFRVSGQLIKLKENAPRANGVYAAPESVIDQLEANPVYSLFGTDYPSGELLTNADIGPRVTARPNEENVNVDLTAKIDFRVSDNIDISLSGSYGDDKNRFTPSTAWSLLNWRNNPYDYNNSARANVRFRHKIGRQGISNDLSDEEKAQKSSNIRNMSYTFQLGYEQSWGNNEDLRHEDRLFDYGYLGNIERSYTPAIEIVPDTAAFPGPPEAIVWGPDGLPRAHQAYSVNSEAIDVSNSANPVLSKYNNENGRLLNSVDVLWSDLYSNVGQVYNNFSKSKSDRYTFNIVSGFDFLPGGSEKGRHSIQFGFTYEQRINRAWSISPFGLWVIAANQSNGHIDGIDYSSQTGTMTLNGLTYPTYAPAVDPAGDAKFYQSVRDLLGLQVNDYVNVDAINPSDLRLDMFSASELNNEGILSYYGYDYLGNEVGNDVTFDDFFSGRDSDGRRTFVVAPDRPIYGAAFIQDKFSYKDIIFRVGVRADYYDANTKVLIDPYALYDIKSAGEFFKDNPSAQPSSVADDYKVYVDGEGSTNVVGYRSGDTWFTTNGTATTDNLLFESLVYPSYKNQDADIRDPNFKPEDSFEDYTPQLNIMPRLAFSFPISEEAGFFAHYDVLYQRPPSNTIQTALDYYYFNDIGRLNPNGNPANNSNLKPVRTIDYEVGFQQKLSQSSALKISAYYKELKDLIQRRFYTSIPAPLGKYETFANQDFGTVKGFTFTYDRRRTGPLEMTVSYTLQFADGSGSDANSSGGINDRGPLRTLIPLSYDERHRLTSTLDYRYQSGKKYTGPTIAGIDIFANMGANLTLTAVSGKPYTARANANEFGGVNIEGALNGARLPWTYSADLRIDKSFSVKLSEEAKRELNFNVYLRVQNLLDTRNVIGVYSYSGDPDNDGFLVSAQGQDRIDGISSARNIEAFLNAYNWRLNNPDNYTQPRRIYVGMIMDF